MCYYWVIYRSSATHLCTTYDNSSFKLQVEYRSVCDFCVEDSERDLSARMIGIDEHFFTPTVERHRQEQVRHEEVQKGKVAYAVFAYTHHLY